MEVGFTKLLYIFQRVSNISKRTISRAITVENKMDKKISFVPISVVLKGIILFTMQLRLVL